MFCRPLGQNFTIHYVWPWLKAFTGSLSLTFSCQMYFLKVLQNFIESGQESKNGKWKRPLQSVTLHRLWWDQGGFCGKTQTAKTASSFGSAPQNRSWCWSPTSSSSTDLRTPPGAEVEAQRGGWMEGRRLSHQADATLWVRLDFQWVWTRDKTSLLQ